MNASNLAVCFVPAFFHLCGASEDIIGHPKRMKRTAINKAAKELTNGLVGVEVTVEVIDRVVCIQSHLHLHTLNQSISHTVSISHTLILSFSHARLFHTLTLFHIPILFFKRSLLSHTVNDTLILVLTVYICPPTNTQSHKHWQCLCIQC